MERKEKRNSAGWSEEERAREGGEEGKLQSKETAARRKRMRARWGDGVGRVRGREFLLGCTVRVIRCIVHLTSSYSNFQQLYTDHGKYKLTNAS